MRVHVAGGLMAAGILLTGAPALGQQMTITAECTTKETGGDGVRHGCESDPSFGRAPPGHVFVQNKALVTETSGAGSEHSCNFGWGDFIEVIKGTGITQPTTFTLSGNARGPSGYFSGRGWVNCTAILELTKFE